MTTHKIDLHQKRNVHLDAVRALAALAVVYGHAEGLFLMHHLRSGRTWFTNFLTLGMAMAHVAVMVFFVLSGYLVGGSVLKSMERNTWSWKGYLIRRLSRLYVVLIPALGLTALLDWIGMHQAQAAPMYTAGVDAVTRLTNWRALAASLVFLQDIHGHCFGSDLPLWSLACEFWYYILFPLMALAVLQKRRRWLHAGIAAGLAVFCGWNAMLLFPGWLAGVGIGVLARRHSIGERWRRRALMVGSLMSLGVTVVAGTAGWISYYAMCWLAGLGASALLWACLSASRPRSGTYALAAVAVSEFSYTLYLTHAPLLLLIKSLWMGTREWYPDLAHARLIFVPIAASVAFAYGMYWLFEARTDAVRKWLESRLITQRREDLEEKQGSRRIPV